MTSSDIRHWVHHVEWHNLTLLIVAGTMNVAEYLEAYGNETGPFLKGKVIETENSQMYRIPSKRSSR